MGDERPDARPDVLLTGLLFYDLVLTGLGKPPTPGEEIWTDGMGTSPGGIANLAVAAARYGLNTSLATVFGDDYYGAHCREVLAEQEHIDLSLSRTADGWHTPVTVSIAYGHDRALVTHGQEPPYSQDALMGDPPAARTALVHIEAEPREWLAKAAANGTKIYADVGWDPTQQWSSALLDQLALCHAFVPNDTEAMAYTRTDTAADALGKLSELVPVAVVTRGGDGALAVDQTTGEYADVPALATEVLDATGAGDVFGASFVAASSKAGPSKSGCASRCWPPDCPYSGTAGLSPRPAGTASTGGGSRSGTPRTPKTPNCGGRTASWPTACPPTPDRRSPTPR